jgi:hypothetical protein
MVTATAQAIHIDIMPPSRYEAREGELGRALEDLVDNTAQCVPSRLAGLDDGEVPVRTSLLLVPDHSLLLEDLEQLENPRIAYVLPEGLADFCHGPRAGRP